jgi:hypothetical protein
MNLCPSFTFSSPGRTKCASFRNAIEKGRSIDRFPLKIQDFRRKIAPSLGRRRSYIFDVNHNCPLLLHHVINYLFFKSFHGASVLVLGETENLPRVWRLEGHRGSEEIVRSVKQSGSRSKGKEESGNRVDSQGWLGKIHISSPRRFSNPTIALAKM